MTNYLGLIPIPHGDLRRRPVFGDPQEDEVQQWPSNEYLQFAIEMWGVRLPRQTKAIRKIATKAIVMALFMPQAFLCFTDGVCVRIRRKIKREIRDESGRDYFLIKAARWQYLVDDLWSDKYSNDEIAWCQWMQKMSNRKKTIMTKAIELVVTFYSRRLKHSLRLGANPYDYFIDSNLLQCRQKSKVTEDDVNCDSCAYLIDDDKLMVSSQQYLNCAELQALYCKKHAKEVEEFKARWKLIEKVNGTKTLWFTDLCEDCVVCDTYGIGENVIVVDGGVDRGWILDIN